MNILLVGHMAAGKTTLAAALGERGYFKAAFADGVKDVGRMAYGEIQKGQMYLVNDTGMGFIEVSGRELMQRIGQSIKMIDQDFWLKIVGQRIEGFVQPIVIDDGRFDFEVAWARKRGWLIVGVNTPEPIRMQRYEIVYGRKPTSAELSHGSEQQVPQLMLECDIVVQGNEDPYQNIKRILGSAK